MSTRSGAENVSEAFQERFQQFFRNVPETFIKKPKQPKSFLRNGSETLEKQRFTRSETTVLVINYIKNL